MKSNDIYEQEHVSNSDEVKTSEIEQEVKEKLRIYTKFFEDCIKKREEERRNGGK